LALAALLVAPRISPAQQDSSAGPKPLVTVALSGYDEIMGDVEFIGKLAGSPLRQLAEAQLQQGPSAEVLAALDTTRPWGFVVQSDEGQFPMFAFLPVKDLDKMLSALEPQIGKPGDAGDGVLEIVADEQTIYLKEKDGWLFIARSPDLLADAPADPLKLLDGLAEQYDLGIRISVANIPPMLRQMAMGPIMMGMQAGMQRLPDESDEQYALRTKAAQQGIEQLQRLLDELDTLDIGLAIDQETKTVSLEYAVTALEGTKTAEQMAQNAEAPSDFAGFALPGAALTLNSVSKIAESDVAQVKNSLAPIRASAAQELENQGLSGADLERAKGLVNQLFDVLDSTLESGKLDIGLSLMLGNDTLTYVSGMTVGDSAKLDGLIRSLVGELIKEEPTAADVIKLDAEEHDGVRMHVLSLPTAQLAADLPNLPNLVGDTLVVVVGIGPDSAYLAAGRDAVATLKKAIDQSKTQADKPLLPSMTLAATPIAEFVALVARDDQVKQVATQVARMLEQAGEKDHVNMTVKPIPNGVRVRIELEESLLKVLGAAPMMMGGPGM
jgi:hypothetical protein